MNKDLQKFRAEVKEAIKYTDEQIQKLQKRRMILRAGLDLTEEEKSGDVIIMREVYSIIGEIEDEVRVNNHYPNLKK